MQKHEEIREAVAEAALNTLKHAETLDKDTQEFDKAVDNAGKLYRMVLETEATDNKQEDDYQRRLAEAQKQKEEAEYRQQQLAEQKRQHNQKMAADLAVSVVKLALFGVVSRWACVLEATGNVATLSGKNIVRAVQKYIELKN